MARRQVVITGLGIVAPQFRSIGELWDGLVSSVTAVRPYDGNGLISLAAPAAFDGTIGEFESQDTAQQKVIRKNLKVMSREIQMAVAASCRALSCADIQIGQFPSERTGISFGSDYILTTADDVIDAVRACTNETGFDYSQWGCSGIAKMQPLWQLKYLPNMPASHIAILNDFHGPSNSMTLREASVGAVIGESVKMIADGRADIMVTGTTGSRLHPFKLLHAVQQEELSQTACRPFDLRRDGTILGEGAGAIILEEREHAEKRGATIWAEVVCGAYRARCCPARYNKNNADSRTDNRYEAVRSVLETVLRQSGTSPENIGHINAHGLGSKTADKAEAAAIHDVFGQRQKPVPVTALKGTFGNLGAGSGMIELIAGILALKNGSLFPAVNYGQADAECPLNVVTDTATPAGNHFIKIAFNARGQASALLLRRIETTNKK
ncbi:MAG: beta-ketoacyl-[acyl-carrier-protein] synthase family protein [Planctomycetaceae bacterium]|jgi:3-oxoacyl-[acyl-carrier-protein] synthase II|nr:beta-ketoacyl-[acyl-carrier-protein] synthase family protein [Planctomycetaceae bacterium]